MGACALIALLASAISVASGQAASGGAASDAPHYVAADVEFMQGMIAHHAQALAMVALIPTRTDRKDMHELGQRIAISQRDEISLMQHWLEDHHEAVPTVDSANVAHMPGTQMAGMQMPGMALMPGMLTPEQMTQLANATGPAFDRLLLQGMIGHHQGALTMVGHLFATPGAGQVPEISTFASDVNADQTAEIRRMQRMLAATPGVASH